MHNFIPASSHDDGPPFTARGPRPEHARAVKQWTRDFLKLDDDAVITVMELACSDPGCPDVETVIAVFDRQGSRKWKLPHAQVTVTRMIVHRALAAAPQS